GDQNAASLYLSMLSKGLPTVGCVAGLGETGTHDDVLFALAQLRSDSPKLRHAAVVATARLGEDDDFEKLVPMLEDKSPRVIAAAARCLGTRPQVATPDQLMDILRRNSRHQVQRAIVKLLQIKSIWPTLPAL